MFIIIEKVVIGMAFLRIISGSIEIFAAILMIKFNTVEKALMVNSSLALIGPVILVLTTSIGLIGLVEKISIMKFVWIALGVSFIFIGVKSS
jgi:putative exporter of polyketide antibiotics